MTEVEAGIEIRGRFSRNGRRDGGSRNRGRSTSRDGSKGRRCHYSREVGQFIRVS